MRVAVFKFIDGKNQRHQVVYNLFPSKLTDRWVNLVELNKSDVTKHINTTFFKKNDLNRQTINDQLKEIINAINLDYDEKIIMSNNSNHFDESDLNYFHEQFEKYGDRLEDMSTLDWWSSNLHNNFLRLNELIHLNEEINDKETFPSMTSLVDYYPQEHYELLTPEDSVWLTSEFMWGDLYLGYNTLGKDWLEVVSHNDLEVIKRNNVRIQKRFAVESWLYFGEDDSNFTQRQKLDSWYNNLPDDLKSQVPYGNINEMSFGRYKIGQLSISNKNKHLKNYCSDMNQWKLPNSEIKKKWCREVFDTFVELKNIEIINV